MSQAEKAIYCDIPISLGYDMNHYSLNGLRMFNAAARHLSFSASAAELNVSQAAVSQQIRRLEHQLNVKLFVRESGRVTLTAAGKELAGATDAALFRINKAFSKITQTDVSGNLTISTLSSFATKWLIPRVAQFESAHPSISLSIHTSEYKVDFSKSGIDGAIRLGAKEDAELCTEPLFRDTMCLVALPERAHSIGTDIENLYNHPLLVDGTPNLSEQMIDLTNLATNKAIDALELDRSKLMIEKHNSSATVVLSALANKGVALTRFSLCMDDVKAGKLDIILNFTLSADMEYSMVYPRENSQCEKLKAFRVWLRRELAMSPSIWNMFP
ncbi:MAG: hypothetical protein AXW12_12295 [Thalassospira sp. Nap_22]|nr:MAG: hypothetical protein AXW12_12295 [Thalassospira sp. Nap_22]